MDMRFFNLFLFFTFSFGITLPAQSSPFDPVYSFFRDIPSNLETFVKDDPKSAAALIAALTSVIVFKDVIVLHAKKGFVKIKRNPLISLGFSLFLCAAVYGVWESCFNCNCNKDLSLAEAVRNVLQDGADSFSKNLSRVSSWFKDEYKGVQRSFESMTVESGQAVREVVEKAKEQCARI